MAISTNPNPTIYRNLYENTGPGFRILEIVVFLIHFRVSNNSHGEWKREEYITVFHPFISSYDYYMCIRVLNDTC